MERKGSANQDDGGWNRENQRSVTSSGHFLVRGHTPVKSKSCFCGAVGTRPDWMAGWSQREGGPWT